MNGNPSAPEIVAKYDQLPKVDQDQVSNECRRLSCASCCDESRVSILIGWILSVDAETLNCSRPQFWYPIEFASGYQSSLLVIQLMIHRGSLLYNAVDYAIHGKRTEISQYLIQTYPEFIDIPTVIDLSISKQQFLVAACAIEHCDPTVGWTLDYCKVPHWRPDDDENQQSLVMYLRFIEWLVYNELTPSQTKGEILVLPGIITDVVRDQCDIQKIHTILDNRLPYLKDATHNQFPNAVLSIVIDYIGVADLVLHALDMD